MRAIVLFFFLSGMLTACGDNDKPAISGGVSQDRLQIVASIKPIQAIVMAIAGEHADVVQLIPDYASPHDYSFKPSDIRKIENADIVFRIDEHMETQLNGAFQNIDTKKTSIVSLAMSNGLTLLESDHSHEDHQKEHKEHGHDEHEDEHKHQDDHKEEHSQNNEHHDDHKNHDNVDFHIWTSPKNAVLMANRVASRLKKFDAKNESKYQQNLERFFKEVKAESEKIAAKVAPLKNKTYIVFHNSWQYFAAEFGLQEPIVIDLHEGVSSGAKTISTVRERIVKENINCVFYDSSISFARLKVITEKAKTVEIDVLAKEISLDQSTYVNWLNKLGAQIESCLSD